MADRKISDLTALTTPAAGDFLPIVDISEAAAASKNKRITIEELMRGVPDGTAAAPGIAFETDPNTGIYSPGADQLAVATNGTGRLFVDASGRVGVGTAAPAQSLDIAGSAGLHLRGTTYTDFSNYWGANDNRAMFLPYGFLGSSGANALSLYANGYRNNTSSFTYMGIAGNTSTAAGFDLAPDGHIIFRNGTAVGTVLPERLRITSAGLVGIGTSAPASVLTVQRNGSTVSSGLDTSTALSLQSTGSAGSSTHLNILAGSTGSTGQSVLTFGDADDPDVGAIRYRHADNSLAFETNAAEKVRINSLGNVGIGTTSPARSLIVDGGSDTIVAAFQSTGTGCGIGFKDGTTTTDNVVTLRATGNDLVAHAGGSERARIDSSGRLLVGTSTSIPGAFSDQGLLQVNGGAAAGYAGYRFTNNSGGAIAYFYKSRSATTGVNTIVQNGDICGSINFAGADGTTYHRAAVITGEVDGTPGANDMPGRLTFSTTADGAASPTERLRITSAGVLQVADAGNITVGTTTGTKIGTATTQKLGFYNATPVVQPTAVADATDAATAITQLNDLLAKLRTLGIIAT
jgi:hypothetical protein